MILKAGTYRFNDNIDVSNFGVLRLDLPIAQAYGDYICNFIYNGERYNMMGMCSLSFTVSPNTSQQYSIVFANFDFETEEETGDPVAIYIEAYFNSELDPEESGYQVPTPVEVTLEADQEVSELLGKVFIANTDYNEVNAKPLATIEYNGQTIAQLNAGDKATIPCSQYKMSKDLAVKVNRVPTIYTASSVDDLPSDAIDGSMGIVKQPQEGVKWRLLSWKGLQKPEDPINVYGYYLWTDGSRIYYSYKDKQYILNGDTWEPKVWNGFTDIDADYIWTDGKNIYYSDSDKQYVLNGNTWEPKTWNGATAPDGYYIWTDGTNTYISSGTGNHFVLNGDTWEHKTWNGVTEIYGEDIWTDGKNMYYSYADEHYILNGDTWETKTWNGVDRFEGHYIWTDGEHTYYNNYMLNGDTWEGPLDVLPLTMNGYRLKWVLGNLYGLYGQTSVILVKDRELLYIRTNGAWVERDILDEGAATSEEITVTPTTETQQIRAVNAKYISKVTIQPIPEGYIKPSGTLELTVNNVEAEHPIDCSQYANVTVNTAEPLKITDPNVLDNITDTPHGVGGNVFLYWGENTDTYENGTLYYLEDTDK